MKKKVLPFVVLNALVLGKVLNRAILWDSAESGPAGNAPHWEVIHKSLEANDELLRMCDALLSETVSYVDEKSSGIENGQLHLQVMTEAIQALRKRNNPESILKQSR